MRNGQETSPGCAWDMATLAPTVFSAAVFLVNVVNQVTHLGIPNFQRCGCLTKWPILIKVAYLLPGLIWALGKNQGEESHNKAKGWSPWISEANDAEPWAPRVTWVNCLWCLNLRIFVPASLSSLGKAGRSIVKAKTCLGGKRDVRFHELDWHQGCFTTAP